MTLGLAARRLLIRKRNAKLAAAFPNGVRCQKCLELGHWSYECSSKRKYTQRTSRTKQLNKKLADSMAVLNSRDGVNENNYKELKKYHKIKRHTKVPQVLSSSSSSTDSSTNDSDSSDSDTTSDSSVSTSSKSSKSSESESSDTSDTCSSKYSSDDESCGIASPKRRKFEHQSSESSDFN